MRASLLALLVALSLSVAAQEPVTLDGRPALVIANDKLALTVRTVGGALANLVMKDDPNKLSPYHSLGHFVCVDGFGPSSPEERRAGLPMHGEANRVPWEMLSSAKTNGTLSIAFSATLPLVQEVFRRTFHIVDGENVIYVTSELESQLAFDRPINWGEHVSLGPPFLDPGKLVVEMSAKRAMTRSYESQEPNPPHRLANFKEFTWPMAPGANGDAIDVRPVPTATPLGDHTSSLMDTSRDLVFVTALHADKHVLLGYVFKRAEYPWTQMWESYPANAARSARGLEFATQPFDLPRRDVITTNSMFETPTYRWLPAKSTITSSFLLFYTHTPDGMTKVDDVVLEGGKLVITDRAAGKTVTLAASRPL